MFFTIEEAKETILDFSQIEMVKEQLHQVRVLNAA